MCARLFYIIMLSCFVGKKDVKGTKFRSVIDGRKLRKD